MYLRLLSNVFFLNVLKNPPTKFFVIFQNTLEKFLNIYVWKKVFDAPKKTLQIKHTPKQTLMIPKNVT